MEAGGTLLCAVDGDDRAPELVRTARAWARATGLTARFAHVCRAPGEADRAAAALRGAGVAEDELRLCVGDPRSELLRLVHESGPALVLVAASSRPAAGAPLAASVCAALVRSAPCPVAVLPRRADGSFAGGPVACAISLGDHDEAAIRFAGAFATSADRRLVLARVVGPQDAARHAATRAFQHIEDARGRLAAGVAGDIALRAGTLADRLVDAARDAGADALVVAARTQEHTVDPLLGSLAHSLWNSAPCPVVFVEGAVP